MASALIPEEGFLRLRNIIGDRTAGIPAIVPVSRSTWWEGVRTGRFPAPIKLGPRTTVWKAADIRAFVAGDWKPADDAPQGAKRGGVR